MIAVDRLAKIEAKIEEAAKHLNPIMAGHDTTRPLGWHAQHVHDALNALTSALAQTHFLKEEI